MVKYKQMNENLTINMYFWTNKPATLPVNLFMICGK